MSVRELEYRDVSKKTGVKFQMSVRGLMQALSSRKPF